MDNTQNGSLPQSVLIVEDSPLHARILQSLIPGEWEGEVELLGANTLESALEVASRRGPDCIILDLILPDADGTVSLEALQSVVPGVAIVVVSASRDPKVAMQVIAQGAHEFLSKWDFSSDELTTAITLAVARSQVAKPAPQVIPAPQVTPAAVDV
ncbi:MAG: response regulator [Acidimicrobiia bacterium]|nr:response regulator [Acidimicrobiia bacterium]